MLQPEMRSSIGRKAGEGMTQTHVPYGYRIEDGKALADEVAAEKLKSFFNESAPAADAETSTAVLPGTTGESILSSGAAAPGLNMVQVPAMHRPSRRKNFRWRRSMPSTWCLSAPTP